MQSLKSVIGQRVNTSVAEKLASNSRDLGEGRVCGSRGHPTKDVYGRPSNLNTLTVNLDATCGGEAYSARELMQFETNHRQYIPICAAGYRGAGDFMGYGRDMIPMDLYSYPGDPYKGRGRYPREYQTPNNSPPDYYEGGYSRLGDDRRRQPFDFSHDATRKIYKG